MKKVHELVEKVVTRKGTNRRQLDRKVPAQIRRDGDELRSGAKDFIRAKEHGAFSQHN